MASLPIKKKARHNNRYKTASYQTYSKKPSMKLNRKPQDATLENFTPNFYNPFEVKRRRRTSREQASLLEKAYIDNPKPSGKARYKLAELLSIPPRGVQVWFQNKRAKEKQQKRERAASVNEEKQFVDYSTTKMTHSFSQPLTPSPYSDPIPSSVFSTPFENESVLHVFDPTMTQPQLWYNDNGLDTVSLSPGQSQVQLDAQHLPLPFGHQTYNKVLIVENSSYLGTRFADHEPQIQACPFLEPNPHMYSDNALTYHQNVDDWVNAVSLFHHSMGPFTDNMSRNGNLPLSYSATQYGESCWPGQQTI